MYVHFYIHMSPLHSCSSERMDRFVLTADRGANRVDDADPLWEDSCQQANAAEQSLTI